MEIRESGSKLSFTKVNGYIVPLEQFQDKPGAWTVFIYSLTVIILAGTAIFMWITLP